jgi:hypothetical protein
MLVAAFSFVAVGCGGDDDDDDSNDPGTGGGTPATDIAVSVGTGAGKTEVKVSGGASVAYDGNKFAVTYSSSGSNDNYENVISRFKVDLGTTKLSQYEKLTFTAAGVGGDSTYKNVFVFVSATEGAVTGYIAKASLVPISLETLPSAGVGGDNYWSDLPYDGKGRVNGATATNITIGVTNASIQALTGEVWFAIYAPAGASSGATKFEFGDIKLVAK